MLRLEELAKWVGQVGWVNPNTREASKTAAIAVKVVAVSFGYGRIMFTVEPLAGVGSWKVNHDRVEFDRGDL